MPCARLRRCSISLKRLQVERSVSHAARRRIARVTCPHDGVLVLIAPFWLIAARPSSATIGKRCSPGVTPMRRRLIDRASVSTVPRRAGRARDRARSKIGNRTGRRQPVARGIPLPVAWRLAPVEQLGINAQPAPLAYCNTPGCAEARVPRPYPFVDQAAERSAHHKPSAEDCATTRCRERPRHDPCSIRPEHTRRTGVLLSGRRCLVFHAPGRYFFLLFRAGCTVCHPCNVDKLIRISNFPT